MFNINDTVVALGKRIQEARLLRNITQDQLAEQCGVTSKHISAIERGSTPGSVVLLLTICNFLNITPNALFIDSFLPDNDNNLQYNIMPLEKHDIIIKYSKLSKNNQRFVESVIEHEYEEQTRRP